MVKLEDDITYLDEITFHVKILVSKGTIGEIKKVKSPSSPFPIYSILFEDGTFVANVKHEIVSLSTNPLHNLKRRIRKHLIIG